MSEGLAGRIQETFLLRRAARESAQTPEATRDQLRRQLLLSRQRGEAADTLWANGHAAEALRLVHLALEKTLEAAGSLGGGAVEVIDAAVAEVEAEAAPKAPPRDDEAEAGDDDDEAAAGAAPKMSGPVEVLVARGLRPSDGEALERAMEKLRLELPEADDEVTPTHAELFRESIRLRRRAHDALLGVAMTPREVKLKRVSRITALVAAVALAIGAVFLMVRTPREEVATASGYFASAPEYAPDKAIDGEEGTEWLLADGQTGWLEVRLSPPRDIQQIRVRNGHNRHFRDRAVRAYAVELFDSNGESVGTTEGEFERFAERGEWAEHPLPASDVSRIRFQVKSFHRTGAALAELEWVE